LWSKKPETASRVRGRIEAILDWAKVRGYRDGENPARWRGHLDHLLPAKSKVRRVRHCLGPLKLDHHSAAIGGAWDGSEAVFGRGLPEYLAAG
jgi:hypothetical protein